MTAWVETQVPCMLYCGPDLCNCSARWFYEELEDEELEEGDYDYEEYEESLTHGKKAQQQNLAYARYLTRLQDSLLSGCRAQVVGKSREIYISSANATASALKSNTTRNQL